jgi:hypothetical protein
MDDLKAQASSLLVGLEQLDAEIASLEGTLQVMRDDRADMARRLGAVERFFEAEGVELPYAGKRGT